MLQFCHVYCENSHVYSGFSSTRASLRRRRPEDEVEMEMVTPSKDHKNQQSATQLAQGKGNRGSIGVIGDSFGDAAGENGNTRLFVIVDP